MSKKIYLGFYIFSLVVFLTARLMSVIPSVFHRDAIPPAHFQTTGSETGIVAFAAIGQFLAIQIALTLTLIYKMWASIEDGRARTTPRKAIALLFVPFFNLYWIFQVWGGFPTDYNRYVDRYELNLPPLSAGIYIVYPILLLFSLFPVFGFFTAIIGLFVFAAIIWKTCGAVNLLSQAAQRRYDAVSRIPIPNRQRAAI
ncbi:MAG: hypothetical protein M3209_05865 [Acidobacteriota bacterium]|nr:hypothetical protein [Acidobacteriota bacterium]